MWYYYGDDIQIQSCNTVNIGLISVFMIIGCLAEMRIIKYVVL